MEQIEDEEQLPLERKAKQWPYNRPDKMQHDWSKGGLYIESVREKRKDTCRKCGCIKTVVIRVGQHDWTEGYSLDGVAHEKAPKCNPKNQ